MNKEINKVHLFNVSAEVTTSPLEMRLRGSKTQDGPQHFRTDILQSFAFKNGEEPGYFETIGTWDTRKGYIVDSFLPASAPPTTELADGHYNMFVEQSDENGLVFCDGQAQLLSEPNATSAAEFYRLKERPDPPSKRKVPAREQAAKRARLEQTAMEVELAVYKLRDAKAQHTKNLISGLVAAATTLRDHTARANLQGPPRTAAEQCVSQNSSKLLAPVLNNARGFNRTDGTPWNSLAYPVPVEQVQQLAEIATGIAARTADRPAPSRARPTPEGAAAALVALHDLLQHLPVTHIAADTAALTTLLDAVHDFPPATRPIAPHTTVEPETIAVPYLLALELAKRAAAKLTPAA
jgi:hypothetical protein